ncbi:hypothetical protein MBAV_005362, partial [Candidatus Magnetobacterium bavaricum]
GVKGAGPLAGEVKEGAEPPSLLLLLAFSSSHREKDFTLLHVYAADPDGEFVAYEEALLCSGTLYYYVVLHIKKEEEEQGGRRRPSLPLQVAH